MPDELRPGLWRWTAPHPEWHPFNADGTPTGWSREVGCVLYESDATVVFIDPLAPAQDAAAFWRWADERCGGRAVSVLETIAYHRRSREQMIARYGAGTVAPSTVVAQPLARFAETVYWIPASRALVPGDCLIGTGAGELSLCPQSWIDELAPGRTLTELRDALAPLCELEAELVLVSHGEPARHDGAGALARALRAT